MKKLIIFLVVFASFISFANAQGGWQQTIDFPDSVYISDNTLVTNGFDIFCGTLDGVYLTSDNGLNWAAINNGLTNTHISALAASGSNIFAGTDDGIFLSTNNGANWTPVNTGLPSNPYIIGIAISGNNVLATTGYIANNNMYLSTNNGATWNLVNGLPNGNVTSRFAINGNNIFVSSGSGGVYLSTDNGANWNHPANIGMPNTTITDLAISGNNLFAVTNYDGVFLSTNNGANWNPVNSGLPNPDYPYESFKGALATSGNNIFVETYYGIYMSTNNGTNWSSVNSGLPNELGYTGQALCISGTNIFAAVDSNQIWKRPLSEMVDSTEQLQLYYSLNYNQSTYNELSNPVILDTTNYGNSDYDWAIPIGFTFHELGYSWDSIGINESGVVGFGDDPGVINVAAFLYVIGDKDGLYLPSQQSYISYKTEGNPGSKILKIQWRNFGMRDFNNNYQTTYNDTINFQIWLYEGTGCIEVHIGNCNVININLYKNGAMFSNETGPYIAIDFDGVPYYPTYAEGDPINPTASINPYNDTLMSLTSTPPSGMVYVFCPNVTSCQADFSYTQANQTVQFTDASTGIDTTMTSYSWDFGDGTTSYSENPAHSYSVTGYYNVCLTTTDYTDTCTSTICKMIYVNIDSTNQLCDDFTTYNWQPQGDTLGYTQGGTYPIINVAYFDTLTTPGFWWFNDGGFQGMYGVNAGASFSFNGSNQIITYEINYLHNQNNLMGFSVNGSSPVALNATFPLIIGGVTVNLDTSAMDSATYRVNSYLSFTGNVNEIRIYTFESGITEMCVTDTASSCQANFFSYLQNGGTFQFMDASTSTSGTMVTEYFWNFGDSTTSSFHNPVHSYVNSGTYSVCLTANNFDSFGNMLCSSTYCNNLVVTNYPDSLKYIVQGAVHADSTLATSAVVILFNTDYGYYNAVDYKIVTNGTFQFDTVMPGHYILWAIPDFSIYNIVYLPTYYGDVLYWQNAYVVNVIANTYGLDIHLVPLDSASGHLKIADNTGGISGTVNFENELTYEVDVFGQDWFGKNGGNGTKSSIAGKNIPIFIKNTNEDILGWALADDNGNFAFANLPLQDYTVNAEKASLQSVSPVVPLTTANPTVNVSINIGVHNIVTSVDNQLSYEILNSLSYYPNPVKDNLNLAFNLVKQAMIDVSIINITGQEIKKINYFLSEGSNTLTMDMGDLNSGIYFVRINVDKGNAVNFKFIK